MGSWLGYYALHPIITHYFLLLRYCGGLSGGGSWIGGGVDGAVAL